MINITILVKIIINKLVQDYGFLNFIISNRSSIIISKFWLLLY